MEEQKYITCPCCDGKIEWIRQFPLAQILSFDYIPLPSLIKGPVENLFPLQATQGRFFWKKVVQNPEIPEEVMKQLSQSNEFPYQGRIYERVKYAGGFPREEFPDMPDEVVERTFGKPELRVRVSPDITDDVRKFLKEQERTLKSLEENVGKTMPTKDIFNLLSINPRYPTSLRDFSFSIREENLGECVVNVDSARSEADIHFDAGPGAYMMGFSLGVAKFAYKGLFRER